MIDVERRLRASWYKTLEEAQKEASEYLVLHGGGQLVVSEGEIVLSESDIGPAEGAA